MTSTYAVTPPRLRIARIVAAIDFEADSKAALEYAAIVGRRYGSALHIAHVIPPETYIMPPEGLVLGGSAPVYRTYQEAEIDAQRRMKQAVSEANLQGLSWEAIIQKGSLRETLQEVFQTRQADLIVLGTHARHGFSRFLTGSAAETVLHEAPCPVLLLGPNVNPAPVEFTLRSLVFATDLCQEHNQGLTVALSFAEEFDAKLTIAHVVEEGAFLFEKSMIQSRVEASIRKQLEAEHTRIQPNVVVEVGRLPEILTTLSREHHADLIVLDAHAPAVLQDMATHFVTGAILKIAAASEVPLLCIPAQSVRDRQS